MIRPRFEDAKRKLSELLEGFGKGARPIRIVKKSAYWHQRFAGAALKVITLGGQSTYLSHYVTTLAHTIYVPDDFDTWDPVEAYEILRHEAVHVRQFERYGWVGMVIIYGLLPLPMGLSWGRAWLEWQAYEETLRAVAEMEGMEAARSPRLHEQILRRFTGPDYGWMWPFPKAIRRWIAGALDRIEAEGVKGDSSEPGGVGR